MSLRRGYLLDRLTRLFHSEFARLLLTTLCALIALPTSRASPIAGRAAHVPAGASPVPTLPIWPVRRPGARRPAFPRAGCVRRGPSLPRPPFRPSRPRRWENKQLPLCFSPAPLSRKWTDAGGRAARSAERRPAPVPRGVAPQCSGARSGPDSRPGGGAYRAGRRQVGRSLAALREQNGGPVWCRCRPHGIRPARPGGYIIMEEWWSFRN